MLKFVFFMEFVTHCTIALVGNRRERKLKSAKLTGMLLLVLLGLAFSPLLGTKIKMFRYSGKLLRIVLDGKESYVEFEDQNSLHIRKIHCEAETLSSLKGYIGQETGLSVDGKATSRSDRNEIWYCDGRPNVQRRYSVGISSGESTNRKFILGQILESDPASGQIVYTQAAGRRGYLTVSPELAREYRARLDQMESVEIKGNFRYDRIKRYFVEE
jgi:hypothetical protein